jgi:hypothetical protein
METCDKCGPGVEAQVILENTDHKTIAFCAHHYRDFALTLLAGRWTILEDNRERLTA